MRSLGKTLLTFALLHFVPQSQACLLLQVCFDFCLCILFPYDENNVFFWVLLLGGLVGLHRSFNFSFFSMSGLGIDLDYCDIEWFALEKNQDHSVIFEIAFRTLCSL